MGNSLLSKARGRRIYASDTPGRLITREEQRSEGQQGTRELEYPYIIFHEYHIPDIHRQYTSNTRKYPGIYILKNNIEANKKQKKKNKTLKKSKTIDKH